MVEELVTTLESLGQLNNTYIIYRWFWFVCAQAVPNGCLFPAALITANTWASLGWRSTSEATLSWLIIRCHRVSFMVNIITDCLIPRHVAMAYHCRRQLYETDIRVPLIVRGPGIAQGTTTAAVATHVDLAATILDMGVRACHKH
jgi:hypothetical protein